MRNRNRHRYGNLLGYVDICLNLLMNFIVLFAFALLLIRLQESLVNTKAKIDSQAKLVIHLSWPDDSDDDVDLWARSTKPDTVVGFKSKDALNMLLDNDNLGYASHAVAKSNGRYETTFGNHEHIMIKDCTETHITVNLHYYHSKRYQPVTGTVELLALQPSFNKLHASTVLLERSGVERTALQFDLHEDCSVTNITTAQAPFVFDQLFGQRQNTVPTLPPAPTTPGAP